MAARPRYVRAALREVFVHRSYIALASALALISFAMAIWLPNLPLLAQVLADARISFGAKLGVALSLLAGIGTNFTVLAAAYTAAIAVLLGLDAALIVYLVRRRRAAAVGKNLVLGSGGVASGLVGVGCAACGSLILGAVLPSLGIAGALAALPLHGEEFGILSVVLLLVSLRLVARSIAEPVACALAAGHA